MRLSHACAQRLGIGLLLGIILLMSGASVLSLHKAVSALRNRVHVEASKVQRFSDIALRFSQAGSDFYPELCINLKIDQRRRFYGQDEPQNNRIPGSS